MIISFHIPDKSHLAENILPMQHHLKMECKNLEKLGMNIKNRRKSLGI